MTPDVLLEQLKQFIKRETKDLLLPVKVKPNSGEKKNRPPMVFKMRLPDKDAETKQIPYVLLQFITGEDNQEPGRDMESTCKVRLVFATYNENGEEGALALLGLMTRIRIALLKSGTIADMFTLLGKLEWLIYPDSTPPYYLGEMMSEWDIPTIESEVSKE